MNGIFGFLSFPGCTPPVTHLWGVLVLVLFTCVFCVSRNWLSCVCECVIASASGWFTSCWADQEVKNDVGLYAELTGPSAVLLCGC